MKKFLCTLLCLCVILGTFTSEAFAQKLDSSTADLGITMSVDKIGHAEITVAVFQSGGRNIGELKCDGFYWLEAWTEDGWTMVEPIGDDEPWTSYPDAIEPDGSFRITADWFESYGILDHGWYRFGKKFMNTRKKGYEIADVYAEFVITHEHICYSEDQDRLCDICLALLPHDCVDEDKDTACDICALECGVFRVVGNADWLGNWDSASDLGIMKETKPGVYTKTFQDVPPGYYQLKITKDGTWNYSWGDNGGDICVPLENQTDLTVILTVRDGMGTISVKDKKHEICHVETGPLLSGLIPRDGLFRVIGDADWLGDWSPRSDLGIMMQRSPGCYEKTFEDVPPGSYSMKIAKDGMLGEGYSTWTVRLTVEEQTDLSVTFTANDGRGTIHVKDKKGKEWFFEDGAVYAGETPRNSVYRVVGNADWMGYWDAGSELGLMTEIKPGYYKKNFEDVPPGNYEFKITDGCWEHSWGDNGGNYCFTLDKTGDVTVIFRLHDGEGTIDLLGLEPHYLYGEDEETVSSDKGSEWGITMYAQNVTPTGMTLLQRQMGGNYRSDLEYDNCCYFLEVLQGNAWTRVPEKVQLPCMLEGTHVMPNVCYGKTLNWERIYGALAPGYYRLAREFFDLSVSNESVYLYAPFMITEEHTCASKDQDLRCDQCLCLMEHLCEDTIGDAECDICGKRISDANVYRVVGNAAWMGDNFPASNQGVMKKTGSGVYKLRVQDVAPGDYSFLITKNGEEGLWGQFSDRYEFTLAKAADVTFTLDLREGRGQVSVKGPGPLELKEPANPDQEVKTEDYPVCFLAVLLLICVSATFLLLDKRKKME